MNYYHDAFSLKELSWVNHASSLDKNLQADRFVPHALEAMNHKTVRYLAYFLRWYQNKLIKEIRCELTLRQGATDERLARGINESGIIAPDYGKDFTGRYFQKAKITVVLNAQPTEESQVFLTHYVQGLVIQYFVMNRTDLSNWEFSYLNPRFNQYSRGHQVSKMVNFPAIQISLE